MLLTSHIVSIHIVIMYTCRGRPLYLLNYILTIFFYQWIGKKEKPCLWSPLFYFILFLPPQFSGARYVLYVHTVIMASSSNGISPLPPPFLSSCNIILSCIYIYIYIHFYWGEEREGGGRRKEEAILVYLLTLLLLLLLYSKTIQIQIYIYI